jgi:hypothetical protein
MAGYYKFERDVQMSGCVHGRKKDPVRHTQFQFRKRFWSEEVLVRMEKQLDLKLNQIYKEEQSWGDIREEQDVFYVGTVEEPGLSGLYGEVHDVIRDGNSGFHCLSMALAMFDCKSGPMAPKDMRMHIHEKAPAAQKDMLQFRLYSLLDRKEALDLWEENCSFLFRSEIDYSDVSFMYLIGHDHDDDYFVNCKHWMDADFVLPIFCKEHQLRAVVYVDTGCGRTCFVCDGRKGAIGYVLHEGWKKFEPDERTFGIHYDMEHYRYIKI